MKNNCFKALLIGLTLLLTAAAPAEEKKSLAPDFTLKDLDGNQAKLSAFKDKSPLVVFFWTTWCPYCQEALHSLSQTLPEMEKEGIVVLPVNAGEPSAKVARFIKKNNYSFRVFLDPDSKASDEYNVYGVPVYFAVDKKGYIRSTTSSFPRNKIRELIKEQ
jgi:peroxiredoxin